MDEIVYDSLFNYFNALRQIGYLSYDKVDKLITLIAIKRFIGNDVQGYLTHEDYIEIEKALYCLFGQVCLINYPELYRLQDMNRMHLGDVTDLAIRTQRLEELFGKLEEFDLSDASLINNVTTSLANQDTRIAGIKEDVTKNKTDIQTLNTDMQMANGKISTLETQAASASNNILNLQNKVSTAEENIQTLQSNVTTAQTDIQTNKDEIQAIKQNILSLHPNQGG